MRKLLNGFPGHADALGQPEKLQLEVSAELLDVSPDAGQLEEEGAPGSRDASSQLSQPRHVLTRESAP